MKSIWILSANYYHICKIESMRGVKCNRMKRAVLLALKKNLNTDYYYHIQRERNPQTPWETQSSRMIYVAFGKIKYYLTAEVRIFCRKRITPPLA